MGWRRPELYVAEPLEHQRIRLLDECEPDPGSDLTLPTDRADDHAPSSPAWVNPLLRGPMQTPAAPSAAGPTGDAGPRVVPRARASTPDPALPDNSAAA